MVNGESNRIKLMFLLDNCPVLHNNPEDCPLSLIRANSVKDKHDWLDRLSDEEISAILREHDQCYSRKNASETN